MLPRRRCPFCCRWFHPHPRLKQRQKTCGRADCRQKQKRKSNQQWRTENLDYFRGAYMRQKAKYGTRADYTRPVRMRLIRIVCPPWQSPKKFRALVSPVSVKRSGQHVICWKCTAVN